MSHNMREEDLEPDKSNSHIYYNLNFNLNFVFNKTSNRQIKKIKVINN